MESNLAETTLKNLKDRLSWALFSLRLGVFIVMFVWVLDKFVHPTHGAKVLKAFYSIDGVPVEAVYAMGLVQLVVVLMFLAGYAKRISYGLVLAMHGASTLISFPKYLAPFDGLLFFAAWPMLAACIALYLLRDEDTRFTFTGTSK